MSLVDTILESDEQMRKLKTESEALQATINAGSKEIGMLMGKGEKDAAEAKKTDIAQHKVQQQNLNQWAVPVLLLPMKIRLIP